MAKKQFEKRIEENLYYFNKNGFDIKILDKKIFIKENWQRKHNYQEVTYSQAINLLTRKMQGYYTKAQEEN